MAGVQQHGNASGQFRQWASKVSKFSSEYDSSSWCATAVLGAPRVYPRYGDAAGAWAPGVCDDNQFLELEFAKPVYVTAIHIYETFNCGGVRRVAVRNRTGGWDTLWETEKVQHIKQSRIFSPDVKTPSYKTNAVKLEVNCSLSGSWVEIDAVELVGRKYKTVDTPLPSNALGDDLAKLVNDKSTGDVVFDVQGSAVHCHRAILSVRSPRLRAMLEGSTTGSVVLVKDIKPAVFTAVLHYIYSDRIPSGYSPSVLVDVWRAASKLEVPGLKAYCLCVIEEKLDTNNVVDVFTTLSTSKPSSENIREVCIDFMASNMAKVTLTPQFKSLSQELMLEIIQQATEQMSIQ